MPPKATARDVVPVKVDARPAVGIAGFKTPAIRHGFVLDQADRHGLAVELWPTGTDVPKSGQIRGKKCNVAMSTR